MSFTAPEDAFLDVNDAHLRVYGNVHADGLKLGQLEVVTTTSTGSTINFLHQHTAFTTTSNIDVGTTNHDLFVDTNASRVGILTNTPGKTLDVNGEIRGTFLHGDGSNITNITSSQWTTVNSNEIHYAGNVGVGVTDPAFKLDVDGDINFTGTLREDGNPFVSTPWTIESGPTALSYTGGNVGIGAGTPSAKLEVTGNAHVSTDLTVAGKIGVGVDSPAANLQVVGNCHVSTNMELGGTLVMGTVTVEAQHALSAITATGNTTPHTVEFQNAGTSLVTTGNVQVGKELHMQYTDNVAKIQANSNVVTEFSRSKKLIKYPRVAMTNSTSGGYEVDASTEFSSNYIWKAFDQDSNTIWHGAHGATLWNSSGDYVGSVELITGHKGDWITLKLPTNERISPRGIRVFPRGLRTTYSAGQAPKDVVVIGSNSGSSWDVIATTTLTNYSFGINPSTSTPDGEEYIPATFDFEATAYYQYVGIIIESIYTGGHSNPSISQLEFLGIPEYDPEAHGTDVTIKSKANVPNTDWLEVYYDAKGLTPGAVGSSISGLGGTTISATKLGDPQVSNDAFVFDGSGDAIVSGATSLSGNPPLSYSVWFKTNSISSGYGSNSIVQLGHSADDKSLGFRIKGTGDTKPGNYRFYVWGGATNESVDTDIKAEIGTWTHATVVYDGLNSKLYIDGKFAVENTNTTTELALDSGAKVTLGNYIDSNGALYDATRSYDGSIANVRLFNRALTTDEIYKLYAYQKEEFGHGDLSMTLKAGRLGIGTSEPRAALDVRGDIIGGCPVFFRVRKSTDTLQGANPIIWNEIMVNKGSGYSTITGKFTAPVSGYYEFIYGGCSGRTDWSAEMHAHKNGGSRIAGASAYAAGGNGHWGRQLMNTVIIELNVGETFHLSQPTGNQDMYGSSTHSYNFFSGKYLSN